MLLKFMLTTKKSKEHSLRAQSLKDYRKDIDGLRAIAVLLVIFNHFKLGFASAGFIGVDVFFVISGFLITSHILKDLEKKHFSIKYFYLKRMKRILPVLFVVLFFTMIAAFFLLIPIDLKNYANSLLATSLSISNIYFWKFISIGYFSTDASKIPLLHTWSLGVEEQFYIFWPLLLILMEKFVQKKHLIKIISCFIITSFFFYFKFKSDLLFVYYSPFTRAFELLIGAFVANYYSCFKIPYNKLLNHILSIFGIFLILFSGLFLKEANYPSLFVLLPCLGSVIIIWIGIAKYPLGTRILSNSVLVFIGLISYSLYLWHWPIIAYLNYSKILIDFKMASIIFLVFIFISFLSWKFIENPFRIKIKLCFWKTLLFYFISPVVLFLTFLLVLKYNNYLGFNKIPFLQMNESNAYYGILKEEYHCIDNVDGYKILPLDNKCVVGDINKNISVLVVGDSHAMASVGMLNVFMKNAQLKAYVATQSGTPFILGNMTNWRENRPMERNALIAEIIHKNKYKYVVLGGYWTYYSYSDFSNGVSNSIDYVIKNGSTPVIILDTPSLIGISKTCGLSRISVGDCFNPINKIVSIQKETRNFLISLKNKYKQIIFIDPSLVICKNSRCFSSIDKHPFYMSEGENSHLSYIGSELIGEKYIINYGNPFKIDYKFSPSFY